MTPWDSPGQNTGVGSHSLLQGIFPTQVSCIAGGFFTSWATRGVCTPRSVRQCSLCAQLLSCVQLFVTPWTAACQIPLSMGLSRHEYWSGLPFPPPGDLPIVGSNLCLLCLLHWWVNSLPLSLLVRKASWSFNFSDSGYSNLEHLSIKTQYTFAAQIQHLCEMSGKKKEASCLQRPQLRHSPRPSRVQGDLLGPYEYSDRNFWVEWNIFIQPHFFF